VKRVARINRVLVCLLGLAASAAGAAEPAPDLLAGPPTVSRTDAGCTIRFAATRPTDVTVRIVDSRGEVVRHLASGMVGLEKAAAPFQANALAQSVPWDGTDDAGRKAPGGCRARVQAGMRAAFDRFLLYEPNGIGGGWARGKLRCTVTKGVGDEFLVAQENGVHLSTLRVFDRNGRYLRCVWPYSLDRPRDVIEPFLADSDWGANDWDGDRVPLSVNHNAYYFFGTRGRETVVTTDGCIVALAGYVTDAHSLRAIGPGGLPYRELVWRPSLAYVWRPAAYEQRKLRVPYRGGSKWRLAAGTDGDFLLADGLLHVVWRHRAADMSPANFEKTGRSYLGTLDQAGDDEEHLQGPDDVTVDADGNLHVLDGESVKVYGRDGAFVREAAKAAFPSKETETPPAIVAAAKNPRALKFPHMLRVAPDGRLYLKDCGGAGWDPFIVTDVEGKAFERRAFPWGHGTVNHYSCVDADGNWYVALRKGRQTPETIWKFSPDGKRLKFGTADEIIIEFDEPARNKTAPGDVKGLFVTRSGDIYVVNTVEKWSGAKFLGGDFHYGNLYDKGDQYNCTRVDVYGPDGTRKRRGLVRSQGLNDVAVDRAGNVYVIEATMYHGAHQRHVAKATRGGRLMKFGYLTPEQANLDPATDENKRFSLTARLMKFSPEGGVRDGEGGRPQLWSFPGVSGLSPWGCGAECPAGQICLDPDERLWVPDAFLYCVKAVDRAGNEMLRVGKYGNEDCKGGGGDRKLEGTDIVVDPEVPVARPSGVAVYRDWLFLSDMYAHRVLRCRLEYADSREVAIP
jgi:hypothetical protein